MIVGAGNRNVQKVHGAEQIAAERDKENSAGNQQLKSVKTEKN